MQTHELTSRIIDLVRTVVTSKPTCWITISIQIKEGGIADYKENLEGKNLLDMLKKD
jgi:hypothetical protein